MRRLLLAALTLVTLFAGCGEPEGERELAATTGTTEADDTGTTTEDGMPEPTAVPGREGMLMVFLEADASPAAVDAIRARLEAHVGAGRVRFVSPEEAHAEFEAMFADEPEMVSGTSPADLPASLRVRPVDREAELAIHDDVVGLEGVKAVVCADRGQCR